MKKLISAAAFAIILSACNQVSEKVSVPTTFNIKQLTALMKNPLSVSKDAIADIAGADANKIKVHNEDFTVDVSKRTILFSWQNGEKKSVETTKGKALSINEYSSLGIGFVTKISKENFQKKFESKTAVQREINRITKDETIAADQAIMEAKHLAANAKIQQFEKLENIGELAYWETPVNALHVFAKGISFTVTTNLTNQKNSKEKAVALAQLVFNNTQK